MIALLLALATPSPAPALPVLKTITHVRATPFCSALRTRIGPAIENLLSADASIAQSPAMIATVSRDSTIFRDYPRTVLDMAHLESLITPLVKSTKAADQLLESKPSDDSRMREIDAQLQAVLKNQQDALNTISGLVGTFQLGEVMSSMSGPPEQWMAVLKNPSPSGPKHVGFNPFPNYASIALLAPSGLMNARMPEFNAKNAGLGYDPVKKFAEKIQLQQADIAAQENTATQSVLAAVHDCSGDASTP